MTLHIADLLVGRPAFWGDSMTCRFGFMIAIAAALLAAPPAKAQAGGDVNGIWLTQAGGAQGHVSKCGGGIFGGVVWLRDPIEPATGNAPVGAKKHKPSLGRRPIIALPLRHGIQ